MENKAHKYTQTEIFGFCSNIYYRQDALHNAQLLSYGSAGKVMSLGTSEATVFCRTQNFEPSHGICPFPQNLYVFVEFGTGRDKYGISWSGSGGCTVHIHEHDFATKYMKPLGL